MRHFKRNLVIGVLFIQIIALPILLIASRQKQDPRSRASTTAEEPQNPAEDSGMQTLQTSLTDTLSFQNELQGASALGADGKIAPKVTNPGIKREVYGFLWYPYVDQDSDHADSFLQYKYLTTLAYAGVSLKKDGTISKDNSAYKVWTSKRLNKILNDASNSGVKIHLRVSLFNSSGQNPVGELLSSPQRRKRAVASIIEEIKNSPNPINGINVDLEPVPTNSRDQFTLFIKELRTELDKVNPSLEIVIDTFASTASAEEGFDLKKLTPYVNGYFIMSFTLVTPSASNQSGSHNPYNALVKIADQYLAKVPKDKIILGFPFYTSGWKTKDSSYRSKRTGGTGLILYEEAQAQGKTYGIKYDKRQKTAWYSHYICKSNGNGFYEQVYFDNEQALTDKFEIANKKDLLGVGFWTFNQDKGFLDTWNAIYNSFGDKTSLGTPTLKPGFSAPASPKIDPNCAEPNPSSSPTESPSVSPTEPAGTETPTPTLTPNPTQIVTPTPTPTQTPTPKPSNETKISLSIALSGIGLKGNPSPKKKEAKFKIEIFGPNSIRIQTASKTLTFDPSSGRYKGSADISIPNSGFYNLYLSSPVYLPKRVDKQLITNSLNSIPEINLSAGDINEDKSRNLLDYNIIRACAELKTRDTRICPEGHVYMTNSDLNSNGTVDFDDINLWLREFNTRSN